MKILTQLSLGSLVVVLITCLLFNSCKKDNFAESRGLSGSGISYRNEADSLIISGIQDSLEAHPNTLNYIAELGTLDYSHASVFKAPDYFNWVQIPIIKSGQQSADNILEILISSNGNVWHKIHSKRYYEFMCAQPDTFARIYYQEMLRKFSTLAGNPNLNNPAVTSRTEEVIFLLETGELCILNADGSLFCNGAGGTGGCFDTGWNVVGMWVGGQYWSFTNNETTGPGPWKFLNINRLTRGWNVTVPTSGGGSGDPNTGGQTGTNVQYEDLHILNKAMARIKFTYGLDLDINTLIYLFGLDCLLDLGNQNLPAGQYYAESECVESVLAESQLFHAMFVATFLSQYNINIPPLVLMELANNQCPPIYGYEAFANCLLQTIVTGGYSSFEFLNTAERQTLANTQYLIVPIHNFLQQHDNSSAAQSFISNALTVLCSNNLTFITVDDLNLLFANPGLYNDYAQFLAQNPNATQAEKEIVLRMAMLGPQSPINNLAERLNCFNINNNSGSNFTHSVTLCIDQPVANSNQSASSKENAGHGYIVIEQSDGSTTTKLALGFYPQNWSTPCHQGDIGAFKDDGGHAFDVSVTWPISDWGFDLLINKLKTYSFAPGYHLSTYNCLNFAVDQLDDLGIQVPQTPVVSLNMPPLTNCHVEGLTPAQLGQELRTLQLPPGATRNTTGGNTPASNCN